MKYLFDLIDTVDVVSFDLFDTLVLRPFIKPQDVFLYLEHYSKIKDFAQNRISAEKKARILNMAKLKKEDCTIDDIYNLMGEDFQVLKDIELNFEKQISVLNRKMFEAFNYALAKNKKVVISTDTYLSKNFIEEILSKLSIKNYDEIFVSSELGISKASGNLFDYILKKYNVTPEKLLHIGDNEVSDIENAKNKNIKTFYNKPLVLSFFEDENNKRLISFIKENEKNPIVSSLIGQRIVNFYSEKDYWVNLGFNYGGILAIGLSLNALEIAKQKNLTDLFFISRDAFFPEEIFSKFNTDTDIKGHYIILNRVLKHKYDKIPKDENNELFKYLSTIKTKGNRIGIVDTSAGTFSAQGILQDYLPDKKFVGIYLHTRKNNVYEYENLSGFLLEDVEKMFNLNFIEILLTSLEPKIEDINGCKPVYEINENKYEVEKRNLYKKILNGERKFVEQYIELFNGYYVIPEISTLYAYISNFWKNLSKDDTEFLSSIKNSVDTQQTMYVSLVNSKQDIAAQLRMRLLKK